ncbi:dTDP-4-dehydrorhamnose reductase [Microbulbifer agarilyticus]|uniref:dTDP-4-dehydrorhamnose reductase n=1 Tax=Microbulbifer agarilyticus TaxID=260552 RepID=UPI001C983CF0|nr:dTDP-4-dehydrorhamnose reductase [Microbulbifer agarilyticus]MBY6212231.1 dTDP-4-dehydrorhamnose reductase [Microbulbifer agarilyticus]
MAISHLKRKALVFGKNGQLAWELLRTAPEDWDVLAMGRAEVDLLDADMIEQVLTQHDPGLVINASAYTAVDQAELDAERAFALNQHAVANIADAVAKRGAVGLIHVSTDFVFDGEKSSPYQTNDETAPLNVYGRSKAAGEIELLKRNLPGSLILRTSWVYSSHGSNFVKTMLRLMSDEGRDHLNIIADQIGTPTWARSLAEAIWCAGSNRERLFAGGARIFHSTDAGVASWYDFAVAIQELGFAHGLINRKIAINPIPHHQYPSPTERPSFSVLDKSDFEQQFDLQTKHWRHQLDSMIQELALEKKQP